MTNAIDLALRAASAADDGDLDAARAHLSLAQQQCGAAGRRERQVVEIAALVVAGCGERAAGLALEHIAKFPDDADVLARIARAAVSASTPAERRPR
jgi:hypothetical protein